MLVLILTYILTLLICMIQWLVVLYVYVCDYAIISSIESAIRFTSNAFKTRSRRSMPSTAVARCLSIIFWKVYIRLVLYPRLFYMI